MKDEDTDKKLKRCPTGMCSMFPNAVIKDDQNPRTPLGLWVGDIAIDTLKRTSEIFRSLKEDSVLTTGKKKKGKTIKMRQIAYPIFRIGSIL